MTMTEEFIRPTGPSATVDPYRDIHKGIRALLFSVTSEAGRIDPVDRGARMGFASHVGTLGLLLESHASHEDTFLQPVLEANSPALACEISRAHASIAATLVALRTAADAVVDATPGSERAAVHQLYLDFALFTAAYLEHQEMEERVVTPALITAIGDTELRRIDEALVASIPPDVMAAGLAVMFPAMNIDDRFELLGGMQAGAPPEVFAGVWALAQSVLDEGDVAALAHRLRL